MPSGRRSPSPLALLRILRGFTQQELAERAGRSKRTIEHNRNSPKISTAVAISSALGVDDPRLIFPDAFVPPRQGLAPEDLA